MYYTIQLVRNRDATIKQERVINELVTMAAAPGVSFRERKYVEALVHRLNSRSFEAIQSWSDILVEHPTDILALRFVVDLCFFTGRHDQMRDSAARVMPIWTSSKSPLKKYVHGLYAFGLVESGNYRKAEVVARQVRLCVSENRMSNCSIFRNL